MKHRVLFAAAILGSAGLVFGQTAPDSPTYWLGQAQANAVQLKDSTEKAGVLTTVAMHYSTLNNAPAAAQAANDAAAAAGRIADPTARFHAYLSLAEFHDAARDNGVAAALAAAQGAAQLIPAGANRDNADHQLASFRTLIGGLAAARTQFDAMTDPGQRATAYAGFARALAESGRWPEYSAAIALANTAAGLIADSTQKAVIQASIVQNQVHAGDLNGAAALASSLTNPLAQGLAYSAFADAAVHDGQTQPALAAVKEMDNAAGASPPDRRAALYLNIAHVRQLLGIKADAQTAVDSAVRAAQNLEPADEADALSAASRLRAELGDLPGAAVLANEAASAAREVTDPADRTEVQMAIAAAEARCGLGDQARAAVVSAQYAAGKIPQEKRHPEGEPPPSSYLDVIQSAAEAGDFATAQFLGNQPAVPTLHHDAALAIAGAEVNLAQYQAAEDTATKEGADAQAAVCGMIAASLARTRSAGDTDTWVKRLNEPSDKVAAALAVAQVEIAKIPPAVVGKP